MGFLIYLLPVRCVVLTEDVSIEMVWFSLVQMMEGAGMASISTLSSTVWWRRDDTFVSPEGHR